MRAARNKTKIRLIQTIKRGITSRIKKQTLNHSHIQIHTHSHKHTNVDLHTNTLTLVEVNTSSKPHIGCKKKKKTLTHTSICTHIQRASQKRGTKITERASVSPILLIFCIPKFRKFATQILLLKTKKNTKMKREGNSRPWRRETQTLNCWEILKSAIWPLYTVNWNEARLELLKKKTSDDPRIEPGTFYLPSSFFILPSS